MTKIKGDSPIKRIKMLLIIFSIILGLFGGIFIYLLIISPGKTEQYLDKFGKPIEVSISEKIFIKIGGVKQGMFIKSKNINNPVLLYVHGGPAFPNYFLIDKYKPGLEDYFTVCYWEQRGGGLSYTQDVTLESMNFDQLTSDAIEVTNYLRKRFAKEKIYLMAHSGGTPFSIMAVSKEPHLYYAYIAIAQITNQSESEKLAYKYMLEQYIANKNLNAVAEFNKYPILDSSKYIIPFYKSLTRDESMHELGIGTMRNMRSVFKDVFIPVWMCRAYTLKEKVNIWVSKFSFIKKTNLIDELFQTDIPSKITKIEIPVYFFSGKYDLTVNNNLSRAYLDKLQAPLKGFYTFDNSAHSPIFEEPKKIKEILNKDVLKGDVSLADKK
jgi:pimeloyl-ACP methyl ester carboxylesterase